MKETEKVYKKLLKQVNKNNNKLVKLCKEYSKNENFDLLQDIIFYSEMVFDDSQAMLLIDCVREDYGCNCE